MTKDLILSEYLYYLKYYKGYSNNTIYSYKLDISLFLNYLELTKIDFTIFNLNTAEKYFMHIENNYNLKLSSISRKKISVKQFYRYLFEKNLISNDESHKILIQTAKIENKEYYSVKDIKRLFITLKYDTAINYRNSLIIFMLYSTGIRVSELINIKLDNINLEQKVILVTGKGNKQRFIPMNDQLLNLIKDFKSNYYFKEFHSIRNKNYLFLNYKGNPISRHMLNKIINKAVEESGLNLKLYPHKFRHICATHLLENGVDIEDVQKYLGHQNISSTEIYLTLSPTYVKENYYKYIFTNKENNAKTKWILRVIKRITSQFRY